MHLAAEDRKSPRAKSQNKNNRRYATSPTPQTFLTDAHASETHSGKAHNAVYDTRVQHPNFSTVHNTRINADAHTPRRAPKEHKRQLTAMRGSG